MKKRNKHIRYISLILFVLINFNLSFAQGWERVFPPLPDPDVDFPSSGGMNVFEEDDGYLVYSSFNEEKRFLWTNENGFQTNATALSHAGSELIKNTDGDFIFAARLFDIPEEDIALTKVAPNGDFISETHYGSQDNSEAVTDLIQDSDGNYLFTGAGGYTGTSNFYAHLYKTNANGDLLWKTTYDLNNSIYNFSLTESPDGGYLICGSTIFSTPNQPYVSVIIKIDTDGNIQWTTELDIQLQIIKVLATNDAYFFYGRNAQESSIRLVKTDLNATTLWQKQWVDTNNYAGATDFIQTTDGGFALTYTNDEIVLLKTDADGNTLWQQNYSAGFSDAAQDLKQTSDGGYILVGYTSQGLEESFLYLIKTDQDGNSVTNLVEGYVQYDINENCINDSGEQGLQDWIVTAQGDLFTSYASVNQNGYYSLNLGVGTYDVQVHHPNEYWNACVETQTVELGTNFDTVQVDFQIQSTEQCPLMNVNMYATTGFRLCDQTQIAVFCSNQGTWLAEDVHIDITFADSLQVLNATVPYTLLSGNTYTFDLGDIDFLHSETFYVDLMLGCDLGLLGQSLCSEALVFPDSSCLPLDPQWSGASVQLSASCEGGEVQMKIQNVGENDMTEGLQYLIIEDDVVMNVEPYGPLDAGESILITKEANGIFYRIESEQVTGHPGFSMPSAFVEGCVEGGNGEVSLGFVNQFTLDDADTFIDLMCQEVVAAYDPNIKVAYPEGFDTPHYIERNTDIEYVIHFQNTGTATANLVLIQDILDPSLDPATIRPSVSSHAYDFELFSDGIVKFTFAGIMLPDSTANEAASHGFVKFIISQKEALPIGTEIHNEAAIYFDNNTPIITNKTLHTIGENFITVSVGEVIRPNVSINIYPNPFEAMTTFELKTENKKNHFYLQLFDATGRMLRNESFTDLEYSFYRKDLNAGIYFYKIIDESGMLNAGKLIIQ